MKIFLIISLNFLLAFTACKKKLDTSSEKDETVTESIEKDIKKLNEELIKENEEIKKAETTITIKEKKKVDPKNIMTIKLKTGTVTIELRPDLAPKHVERMRSLSKKGFYNGLKFHRVIEGFMAQTGDPQGDGTGGSDLPNLESEFNSKAFDRGVLGMARSASPHSANSQFFIMLDKGHFLNNKYTVFGEVTSGMEHVDKIKLGDQAANGSVTDPDTMLEVTIGD